MAFVDDPIIIESGEWKLISTGIYIKLPAGFEAQVRPRSGLALKKGITTLEDNPHSIGIKAINNIRALIICNPILSTILAKFIQSSCIRCDAPSTFASTSFQ